MRPRRWSVSAPRRCQVTRRSVRTGGPGGRSRGRQQRRPGRQRRLRVGLGHRDRRQAAEGEVLETDVGTRGQGVGVDGGVERAAERLRLRSDRGCRSRARTPARRSPAPPPRSSPRRRRRSTGSSRGRSRRARAPGSPRRRGGGARCRRRGPGSRWRSRRSRASRGRSASRSAGSIAIRSSKPPKLESASRRSSPGAAASCRDRRPARSRPRCPVIGPTRRRAWCRASGCEDHEPVVARRRPRCRRARSRSGSNSMPLSGADPAVVDPVAGQAREPQRDRSGRRRCWPPVRRRPSARSRRRCPARRRRRPSRGPRRGPSTQDEAVGVLRAGPSWQAHSPPCRLSRRGVERALRRGRGSRRRA